MRKRILDIFKEPEEILHIHPFLFLQDYYHGLYHGDYTERFEFENEVLADIDNDFMDIISELKKHNILSNDFINPGNLGFKNKKICYYDLGVGDNKEIPKDYSEIDENTSYGGSDGHSDIEEHITKIFNHLGIHGAKRVGNGSYGVAFEFNGYIMKITKDISEGNNARKMIGIDSDCLARYYAAKPFKCMGKNLYFLILEEIEIDEDHMIQIVKTMASTLKRMYLMKLLDN